MASSQSAMIPRTAKIGALSVAHRLSLGSIRRCERASTAAQSLYGTLLERFRRVLEDTVRRDTGQVVDVVRVKAREGDRKYIEAPLLCPCLR